MVNSRPVSIDDLAHRVASHAQDRQRTTRYVLGIAGPPAAGKSTLATALRDHINAQSRGPVAEVAPMDGFHLGNEALMASGKVSRKGAPDTFAVAEFADLLGEARKISGEDIFWPTYDREVHEPVAGGARFSLRTEIVIVEGNYLFLETGDWRAVGNHLDERWYLDSDLTIIERRLFERHVKGGKSSEEARRKMVASDLPNAQIVAMTKSRAHLILVEVDGSYYLSKTSPSNRERWR